MAITTLAGKGQELTTAELDQNFIDLDLRTAAGWKDLVSPMTNVGVPTEFAPQYEVFGPSGLRKELKFDVNDYAYVSAFHVGHDIKPGGKAYVHVHWSTSGISTLPVRWEFQISRALGHNQAYFSAETAYVVEQSSNGGAWRHMIAEVSDLQAITLIEPDELILVTVRRLSNGATDNPDGIFGLLCDFHYEADRDTTINKAPNFYL
jgi:hypothetical protein